jgi:hypothetical protein
VVFQVIFLSPLAGEGLYKYVEEAYMKMHPLDASFYLFLSVSVDVPSKSWSKSCYHVTCVFIQKDTHTSVSMFFW